MKRNIFCLIAVSLGMTACIVTTPVVTKQPATVVVKQPATTVVTTKTVTTPAKTVYVNATSDLSYDLDLQAVAIAFAEARTLEEFEWFLNDYSRQISNLDLNRDGYVDYLRVVEQIYNGTHLIIIQDVYAMNACQDVATIVVENSYYTQIIGNPYLYGANYIIEPVFVSRPAVYSQWGANYKSWSSPYYWNHYPSRHQHRAPKPQQTYYSHIDIYITNHYYCSDFGYADTYHYNSYPTVYQSYRRNDYGSQYPDQSFDSRLSTKYNDTRAANARQLSGTRDISSTRTISMRSKSSSSTSGTRASSTGNTQNNNSATSAASRTATRSSTGSNTETNTRTGKTTSNTTGTRASATTNTNTRGKVTTTSHTANSNTTTTSRTSGNTTRSSSTTRMVDGDKQVTTRTSVQASPSQTKITTTTTTTDPTSTSTRKVTTTTKTDRTTGQTSTRSKVSERSSAVSNRAETNQSTTRSRANENTNIRENGTTNSSNSRTNSSTRTRR